MLAEGLGIVDFSFLSLIWKPSFYHDRVTFVYPMLNKSILQGMMILQNVTWPCKSKSTYHRGSLSECWEIKNGRVASYSRSTIRGFNCGLISFSALLFRQVLLASLLCVNQVAAVWKPIASVFKWYCDCSMKWLFMNVVTRIPFLWNCFYWELQVKIWDCLIRVFGKKIRPLRPESKASLHTFFLFLIRNSPTIDIDCKAWLRWLLPITLL